MNCDMDEDLTYLLFVCAGMWYTHCVLRYVC